MWTQEEISKRIRDALFLLDPEISLEPGTPERKIVDAVAASMAEVQVERFIQNYAFDIDTKFGNDLDDFVGIFGFARQAARRASGFVTFARGAAAPAPVLIPAGTQVSAPASSIYPEITFVTVVDGIIPSNKTSVKIPIEAVIPGSIGNIAAGRITKITSANLSNVTSVINNSPITGGTDQEADAELKVRFRNTVFRSIAGTNDQFLALALAAEQTNRAVLLGPVSKFTEYVQVPASGTVTSFNPHAKYIYDQNFFLSANGVDTGTFYVPDVDYSWGQVNGGGGKQAQIVISNIINTPPTGTAIGTPTVVSAGSGYLSGDYKWAYTFVFSPGGESSIGNMSDIYTASAEQVTISNIATQPSGTVNAIGGTVTHRNIYRWSENYGWNQVGVVNGTATTFTDNVIALGKAPPSSDLVQDAVAYLEHQYISKNSRNIIDIDGKEILNKVDVYISGQDAYTASDIVMGPGVPFVGDSTSKYYNGNYVRGSGTTLPTLGNRFIQLLWAPVMELPSELVVDGVTYTKNADYWLCKDSTVLRNSPRARDGIEVSAGMGSAISSTNFPITYTFDRLPMTTNSLIDQHKQAGQDVLVHTAKFRYYRINLVVIYKSGFTKSNVDQEISNRLSAFFEEQPFGAIIQAGDILNVIYQAPGVDSVRYATVSDNASRYGIEELDADGNFLIRTAPNVDLILDDIDLPVFSELGPNTDKSPIQKTQNTWTA